MKKYVALLLVLIFALSFMSAVAFAEGEVKSPEGIDPAPVDKPVVSPQTGIGGNLSMRYGIHMIWVSVGCLLVSFFMMFSERVK